MSERHTITCDVCEAVITMECTDRRYGLPDGWAHVRGDDFCPSCTQRGSAELAASRGEAASE